MEGMEGEMEKEGGKGGREVRRGKKGSKEVEGTNTVKETETGDYKLKQELQCTNTAMVNAAYTVQVSWFFLEPLLSNCVPLGQLKLANCDVNPACLFLWGEMKV